MHSPILNRVLLHPESLVGADLDKWLSHSKGTGLEEALQHPNEIITQVEAAGLRGLGGAGFPVSTKWRALAEQPGRVKIMLCNGNEDEPGTFKDRFLLEHTPHQVIEGMLIAAIATGASRLYLYINPHQKKALQQVRAAVLQWQQHPLFDVVAQRLPAPLELSVLESSGRYIGGEDTAAIATLEGGFPFPRRKPPFPSESGAFGLPTLVNNTETFANIPHILGRGVEWFCSLGLGKATGTKLYSLSGDVLKPGLYELPMGVSLRELIFEHGGGMLLNRKFKAVFTGGPSNTLLLENDLDVALDFESVKARGSRLGTGAMIVISEGVSVVRKVAEYLEFFAEGSCGQCPSCRSGTAYMSQLVRRIDTGRGIQSDLAALENLTQLLPGSGRCGLVDGAVTVVASSLARFRHEYEEQLVGGKIESP